MTVIPEEPLPEPEIVPSGDPRPLADPQPEPVSPEPGPGVDPPVLP